jgi:23S rRNA pseudouridine2605 synthase
LILQGRVRVNGRPASKLGTKVTPGVDSVTCDGERVAPHDEQVYLLVHKPSGVLTSLSDPQRRPVIPDLLPRRGLPRLFPVGRLDYQTEGLLLLTNDGALAHALMHPSFGIEREYLAKVRGCPTPAALARLEAGVTSLGERLRAESASLSASGVGSSWLRLVVREGRYHAIRRMCEAIGHPVLTLKRVRLGPIVLGRLARGAWRRLSAREVANLRRVAARKTP